MKFLFIIFFIFITFSIIYYNHKYNILYLSKSNIHGIGVFTKKDFNINDFIFTGIKHREITHFGSKINHSWNPNTYLKKINNNYNIYAKTHIKKNNELTIDYRYTPDFIQKPLHTYR